jgi:maleylacetoacetate isomerase
LQLYTYFRSSAAYRVRIALQLKGLDAEQVFTQLRMGEQRSPAYRAVNPQGLVPALEYQGEVFGQSLAILEFLDELQPSPPLLPATPVARAQVRAMALAIACDIHPLNNLRVLNYLRDSLHQPQDSVEEWYRHWVHEGFSALEIQARRHSGDGRHLFGDSVTMADVCLVPQVYNARRFKIDVTAFPMLIAISSAMESLPAFAAARPEVQPDAE